MPVLLSYMIRPATFVRKAATPKLETHMMDGNDLPNLRETSVCIRCRKHDALDYPTGHGGQLCGGCVRTYKSESTCIGKPSSAQEPPLRLPRVAPAPSISDAGSELSPRERSERTQRVFTKRCVTSSLLQCVVSKCSISYPCVIDLQAEGA